MRPYIQRIFLMLILMFCFSASQSQVTLPRLIRDSMVLQRDAPVKIWGWATPGESVSIRFMHRGYKTVADGKGGWEIRLPPSSAGGPYTMIVSGKNTIRLKDILIGDVWLCSGQSNMEHQMRLHAVRYQKEISTSENYFIRQFLVPKKSNLVHGENDLDNGYWHAADAETTGNFSAVAYFFAKALYEKYRIPIGIINASVGGSPIQAWMSEDALLPFASILRQVERNKDSALVNKVNRNADLANAVPLNKDRGLLEKWYDQSYMPSHDWKRMSIPGYWEDQGIRNLDGTVWYRRNIDVPPAMAAKDAVVFLGRIVDADELYINGQRVGSTSYLYPQRIYHVPEGTLKSGDNTFVVRVTKRSGKGGFVPDKAYFLASQGDTIDLTGYWQYKVGQVFDPLPTNQVQSINVFYQPTGLYNAMIAPLTNYRIKGFVWYQGESNTGNPALYGELQSKMINEWREIFTIADAPFLFTQLPGFMEMSYIPEESKWAEFREVQRKCLSIPNTGMAVTIDLGEWNDVHPDRKKEVGDRLALQAQKVAFHEQGTFSGPVYLRQKVLTNKIELSFTDVGSGLMANDAGDLCEFEIAGVDEKYYNAKAAIAGEKVIVWSDRIKEPRYVRYAWKDNPVNPNLYNNEGLPASPFSTNINEAGVQTPN